MLSWDAGINRAHELAENSMPARELLTFYATVLESQKEIYDWLRGRRNWLPAGSVHEDLSVLREQVPSFLQSVLSVSPPALADQAARINSFDDLLLEYWTHRLEHLFFPKAFFKPYAHWFVQSGVLLRQSTHAAHIHSLDQHLIEYMHHRSDH